MCYNSGEIMTFTVILDQHKYGNTETQRNSPLDVDTITIKEPTNKTTTISKTKYEKRLVAEQFIYMLCNMDMTHDYTHIIKQHKGLIYSSGRSS